MHRDQALEAPAPAVAGSNGGGAPSHDRRGPAKVRKGSPIRTAIILIVLALLLGAAYLRIQQTRQAANEKAKGPARGGFAIPVIAGTVQQKDVPVYLDGLGTVQALNTVLIRTRVDGQVVKIAFVEGQEVKAGDLLAQIDPAPYQAALDQASAKQMQDEATLAYNRLESKRYVDLLQKKVISQDQFDYQTSQTALYEATVRNDQAAVEAARVQLDYTKIVSPLDGRIGIRQVDQGNIVHAADTTGIVVVTQLHPISLIFTLPQQDLPQIQKQIKADGELKVFAVDRDNATPLGQGVLKVIDNEIDTTTGTLRLKAQFQNEEELLWPGGFTNVRLLVATRKNGVVVPASVVQRGPDSAYAYVIKPSGHQDAEGKPELVVEMRPLKVAQIDQGLALIDSGLSPGEEVVVDGQYKLQPNSKVRRSTAVQRSGSGSGPDSGSSAAGKPVDETKSKPAGEAKQ